MREFENYETEDEAELSKRQVQRLEKKRKKAELKIYHVDIINDDSWWKSRPWLKD